MFGLDDTPKHLADANPPLNRLAAVEPEQLTDVAMGALIVILVPAIKRRKCQCLIAVVPACIEFRLHGKRVVTIALLRIERGFDEPAILPLDVAPPFLCRGRRRKQQGNNGNSIFHLP